MVTWSLRGGQAAEHGIYHLLLDLADGVTVERVNGDLVADVLVVARLALVVVARDTLVRSLLSRHQQRLRQEGNN